MPDDSDNLHSAYDPTGQTGAQGYVKEQQRQAGLDSRRQQRADQRTANESRAGRDALRERDQLVTRGELMAELRKMRGAGGVKVNWPIASHTGGDGGGSGNGVLVMTSGVLNGQPAYVRVYAQAQPTVIPGS